jgi:hypothetical protein
MTAHLFLAALFLLTVAHLVTLKICSVALDHRTAPLYISGWTLLGLLTAAPVYGHLAPEGWAIFMAKPHLLALAVLKGVLLYVLLVISQELMKESLSSRHFVTPLSVGLIAGVNFTLGERLTAAQWTSALGLCALSAAFFFKGHLAELSRQGRMTYAKLVALSVIIAAIDHTALQAVNWYALLLVGNVVLLSLSLALNRTRIDVLKTALLTRPAAMAGFFYAATELVKYYQQVTINPVTAVVTVQAATKPVILALSAVIWKERTLKEQLAWGLAAFVLVMAPMAF